MPGGRDFVNRWNLLRSSLYDLLAPARAYGSVLSYWLLVTHSTVQKDSQSSSAAYTPLTAVLSLAISCERCGTAPRELSAT